LAEDVESTASVSNTLEVLAGLKVAGDPEFHPCNRFLSLLAAPRISAAHLTSPVLYPAVSGAFQFREIMFFCRISVGISNTLLEYIFRNLPRWLLSKNFANRKKY
jgi:hypothetical protein